MTGFSPAVLLILSIVTSGYILASWCYLFRYRTARESGHRLYLTSAALGSLMTSVNTFLLLFAALLMWWIFDLSWERIFRYSNASAVLVPLSAMNVFLSILLSWLYNRWPKVKEKNLQKAWQKDDFSVLLDYATHRKKLVALTLDSRKVYVGLVARTNEPQWESSHVTLLTLYSGYRVERDLELTITNRYEEVFDYFECQENDKESPYEVRDFYVVIPLARIVSSHIFNPDIYRRIAVPRVAKQTNILPQTVME